VMTARLLGIKTAIQEQNSKSGATNRILGKVVHHVFLSFDPALDQFARAKAKGRVTVTGNPIRRFIRLALEGKTGQEDKNGPLNILVVGGSQGAHRVNTLFCEAMGQLMDLQEEIKITHQTGQTDKDEVAARYKELGFRADVVPFIRDMADALNRADLIISRAGAGAVAEIALSGKPSILIPFPYAAGDHQTVNAGTMVEKGAAILFPDREEAQPSELAKIIKELVQDSARRKQMGRQARRRGRPDAAKEIVDKLLELADK